MEAIVKTKSNFRNLNGKSLEVVEMVGTRVSCKVFDENLQKEIIVDFNKDKEVLAITMGLEGSIVMKNDVLLPRKPSIKSDDPYSTKWYRWMKKMQRLGFTTTQICTQF